MIQEVDFDHIIYRKEEPIVHGELIVDFITRSKKF